MKVERTIFEYEGVKEPCIMVSNVDGSVKVRISTCYHLIGRNSLYVREILDGDFNSEDEWTGNFDELTDEDAIRIAKSFSAYLND